MLVFAYFFFFFTFLTGQDSPSDTKRFLPCLSRVLACKQRDVSRSPLKNCARRACISELHAASFFIHHKPMCGMFENLHPRPSPSHSARLRTIVRLNRSFDHWLPRERSCIDKKKRNASLRPFNKTLFARPETRRIFIEISSFSETTNRKEKKNRNESLELVVKARRIRATRC